MCSPESPLLFGPTSYNKVPETVNPSAFFNTCPVRQQSLRIQIALGIVTSADPYKKSFPKSVIGIFGFMSILYTSPGEKSTGNRKNVNIRRKHGKTPFFELFFMQGEHSTHRTTETCQLFIFNCSLIRYWLRLRYWVGVMR